MNPNWYLRSRRRYFLDYHIDCWDEKFLSQYDPEVFAEHCKEGGATAATYMANTHSGMVNWPTKLGGKVHPKFEGKDMVKATIDALHKRGLDAILYYVFVYVVDYWEKHPEARTMLEDGDTTKTKVTLPVKEAPARFATVCFNDPGYRKQSLGELAELCDNYDFDGVWPDMTFWPAVCYCENCQKRYRAETGKEMPRTLDWKDPDFVELVRVRQRWLREFCQEVTDTVKSRKPGMKLAHQSSLFLWDWMGGASGDLADCWDWMSADQYFTRYGLSYMSKVFYSLSNIKPFERVNCWNYPNIHEHVLTKSEDELNMIAYSTIMNDGALTVIDQINPIGTVHSYNYKTMRRVFDRIAPYEPYLGGEFRQDVAIYYSLYSNFDQTENGKPMKDAGRTIGAEKPNPKHHAPNAHMKAASNAAETLMRYHVPYGIATERDLDHLDRFKVIILPNIAMMSQKEMDAFRKFVSDGGRLHISKEAATIDENGNACDTSLLSDLIGAEITGRSKDILTYIEPTETGKEYFPEIFCQENNPVTLYDWQTFIRLNDPENTVIWGTQVLPDVLPNEDRFASILTAPPGNFTGNPALILHSYGKGQVLYSTGLLEIGDHISQREAFYKVIRGLYSDYCTKLERYPSVEITRFEKDGATYLYLLNYQTELPNISIYDLQLEAKLYDRQVDHVEIIPDGTPVPFTVDGDDATLTLKELQDFIALRIHYKN